MSQRIVVATVHHGLLIPQRINTSDGGEKTTYIYNEPLIQALIDFVHTEQQKGGEVTLVLNTPDLTLDEIPLKKELGDNYVSLEDLKNRLGTAGVHAALVMTAPDSKRKEMLGNNYLTYYGLYDKHINQATPIQEDEFRQIKAAWDQKIEDGKKYCTAGTLYSNRDEPISQHLTYHAYLQARLYKKLTRSDKMPGDTPRLHFLAPEAETRMAIQSMYDECQKQNVPEDSPFYSKSHTLTTVALEMFRTRRELITALQYEGNTFDIHQVNLDLLLHDIIENTKTTLLAYIAIKNASFFDRRSASYKMATGYLALLNQAHTAEEQCFIIFTLLANHNGDKALQERIAKTVLEIENPSVKAACDHLKGYIQEFIVSRRGEGLELGMAKEALNKKVAELDTALQQNTTPIETIYAAIFPLLSAQPEVSAAP